MMIFAMQMLDGDISSSRL